MGSNAKIGIDEESYAKDHSVIPNGVHDATALGANTKATVSTSVALGQGSLADVAEGKAGYDAVTGKEGTNKNGVWTSKMGAVSVGDSKRGLTRQIVNVAAGSSDTDAANIAQLKAVQTANENKIKDFSKTFTNELQTKANKDASNLSMSDKDAWKKALGDGEVKDENTGLVNGGAVYEAVSSKADLGYVNAMAAGLNQEIQNTAMGLHDEIQNTANRLTKDNNRVGAGAAALAALHPQDYDPDNKLNFAAGYGHYKNANASAIGLFYRPNAGTTISLAGTIGNGDSQISAGLSLKMGMGKNVERVIVKKKDYDELKEEVEEQNLKLQIQELEIQELKELVVKLLADKN